MNPIIRLSIAASLIAAATVLIATPAMAAEKKSPMTNAPPPPGLNDPGVSTPQSAPPADAAAASTRSANDDPLAPPPKPDARLVRDKASRDASANAQRVADSQVTKRKQGDDTVEEYRERGHVWMIKIVPQTGPTQTFMASDGSGRLVRDANEGPVSPVYYTLYEWK